MLAGLREGKRLASFPKCVEERICANGVRLFDDGVRMVSANSGIISEGFCCTPDKYYMALNEITASSVERGMECGQGIYANPEFRTQRMVLTRFVRVRGDREEREKVSVQEVLLIFCCLVKEEIDGNKRAVVQCKE